MDECLRPLRRRTSVKEFLRIGEDETSWAPISCKLESFNGDLLRVTRPPSPFSMFTVSAVLLGSYYVGLYTGRYCTTVRYVIVSSSCCCVL